LTPGTDFPFVHISGLTYTYAGEGTTLPVTALSSVSLDIQAGEYVALVGANGSGKSTLARHLNSLLLPTAGDVWIEGHNTRDPTHLRGIRSAVGMVFQSPEDQLVATIVEEDVAFGPENLGVPEDELPHRVREALQAVDMWEHRDRPPHLLSAGQQQRVAIAGALAMRPRCLVLDEATAMLDPAGRRELLQLLDDLHAAGLTIVAITHHMDEATRAGRVIVLHQGQIAIDGSPADVFADAGRLTELRLDLPPVADLASRLRPHFPALPAGLLTAQSLAQGLAKITVEPGKTAELPVALAVDAPGETPAGDSPLIAVRDLHHTYMAGTPLAEQALYGVDFALQAGDVAGLIGPTGSGKSTLLQHLNGLLLPQSGSVSLEGQDLSDPSVDLQAVRRTVGLVFQKPETQLFETYVGDDVAYGPRMAGLAGAELRERVRWAMEMVGLDFANFKDRLTTTLSGGEQRKAALAGVLALRPKVLVLDEPTSGLDPAARAELLVRLNALQEQGQTQVIATHNMDDIAAMADRVHVMVQGKIALSGGTREVFDQAERLRELGLGVPATVEIGAALREAGISVPPGLLTLDELEGALVPILQPSQPGPAGVEVAEP